MGPVNTTISRETNTTQHNTNVPYQVVRENSPVVPSWYKLKLEMNCNHIKCLCYMQVAFVYIVVYMAEETKRQMESNLRQGNMGKSVHTPNESASQRKKWCQRCFLNLTTKTSNLLCFVPINPDHLSQFLSQGNISNKNLLETDWQSSNQPYCRCLEIVWPRILLHNKTQHNR